MKFELGSRRLACAALLLGAAGAASAQSADDERGFYVGALAGVANYPARPKLIVGNFTLKSTDTRSEDMSWGFTAGYRFNRHLALEGGYIDLGEATAKMIDSAGSDLRGDLRFAARGEMLALVAFYPFGQRWEWFVKAGLLFQDVDFRLSGTQGGVPYRLSSSSNGPVTLYSEGGIGYRFETHWKAEDLVTAADASNTRHTGSSLRAFRDAQERDFILAGAFPSGRSRRCVHRSVTSSGRSHIDRGCVLDARGGGPRSDDGRHAVCDLRREPAGLLCGDL